MFKKKGDTDICLPKQNLEFCGKHQQIFSTVYFTQLMIFDFYFDGGLKITVCDPLHFLPSQCWQQCVTGHLSHIKLLQRAKHCHYFAFKPDMLTPADTSSCRCLISNSEEVRCRNALLVVITELATDLSQQVLSAFPCLQNPIPVNSIRH